MNRLLDNRTLVNVVLAVSIAGLAGYLVYTAEDDSRGPAYAVIDPTSIKNITISQPGKHAVLLAKLKSGWWLEQPFRVHANRLRINSILRVTRYPSEPPFSAQETELARLGLDDHALRLSLDNHQFKFGKTDPINNKRYVMYNDMVYLLEDDLYFQLRQDPYFFAGTKLVPSSSEIIQLDFPHVTLVREGDNWSVIPKQAMENDNAGLLAERWQNAEATVLNPYSGSTSLGTVTLHLKNDKPVAFDIASLSPTLILARTNLGIQYFMGNYNPALLGLDNLSAAH